MVSDELANLVSSWLGSCKNIIEQHQGSVNKYLGDGILAYWREDSDATQDVISAINALKAAQTGDGPPFRFVVHFGTVAVGGMPSTREETLMGSEVNPESRGSISPRLNAATHRDRSGTAPVLC